VLINCVAYQDGSKLAIIAGACTFVWWRFRRAGWI